MTERQNHLDKNRVLFPKDGNIIVLSSNMVALQTTNSLHFVFRQSRHIFFYLNNLYYHMTRTALGALSLQNHL